ncbi:MAG: hypothetical protein ABII23_04840 [bacterium]
MRKISIYFLIVCICSPAGRSYCASYNKQRVRSFDWHIVETDNFYLYYYDSSEPLLEDAIVYIEKSYQKLIDFYQIQPQKEKIPFFLFAEHNEFEQTNIVSIGEGTGGVTEAFKNRLLVFNDGSKRWLENVITHEMTHIMQFYILYGGFWRSVRLLKSFFYPLWVMEGLAEYGTGELDRTTREMYIRDAATSGGLIPLQHLHNFNHLKPHQITLAYKESEMAMRFLADEYGVQKIINILRSFKARFDSHTVLTELIGTDLFGLSKKFIERLEEEYEVISSSMTEPEVYGRRITPLCSVPVFNTSPVFTPDGDEILYMTDTKGYEEIYAYNIAEDKHVLVLGQKPSGFEYMGTRERAFSISPSGRYIAFAAEKKQKDFIFIFDRTKHKLKKLKTDLSHVASPVFSPDGKTIAFKGMKDGITDLYVIDIDSKKSMQLTHDVSDDRYPAYMPDGKSIVYSKEIRRPEGELAYARDLYRFDIETGTDEPILSLPGDENYPSISPDGARIYFINDQHDVFDMYYFDLTTKEVKQLSHIIGGNFSPSLSPDGSQMVFSSFRNGNMHVYVSNDSQIPEIAVLPEQSEDIFLVSLDSALTEQYHIEAPEVIDSLSYTFNASTDLFFPVLFYSSLDGLFAQIYYQASEMLGNHQMSTNVGYASGDNFLNYDFIYGYSKFKPQFFAGASGRNYYEDFDETERRTRHAQFGGASYPLNRFASISVQSGTVERTTRYADLQNLKIRERENFIAGSLLYDITSGKYLEIRRGYSLRASYEYSNETFFDSDYDYRTHMFEGKQYAALGISTFYLRLLGGVSFGANPGDFRLGGVDRVRGFSRGSDEYKAPRAIMGNLEWRIPLANLNYYMWYLFPDFFFKRMTGVLFTDAGFVWDTRDELTSFGHKDMLHSAGIGLRFFTFLLQTFRLDLSFDWAKRTTDGKDIFYFSFGPEFYLPASIENGL